MPPLTVTVITLNEAANIEACLAAVDWVDDIVVVDSGSTDGTVERAKARGARVIQREWPGSYAAQKNFAAEQTKHDWILSLDADERVTPALADEIRAILAGDPPVAGATAFPADVPPRTMDPHDRLSIPTTSCGSTTAAAPTGRRVWSTSR